MLSDQAIADAGRLSRETGRPLTYHFAADGSEADLLGTFSAGAATVETDQGRRVKRFGELVLARSEVASWDEADWVELWTGADLSGRERWEVVAVMNEDALQATVTLSLQRVEVKRYAGSGHEKGIS